MVVSSCYGFEGIFLTSSYDNLRQIWSKISSESGNKISRIKFKPLHFWKYQIIAKRGENAPHHFRNKKAIARLIT